jgi:hypothetical protein
MDNAQALLDSLSTFAEVQALVGRPEDLYFEAKTCSTPFSERDKMHLAEALSGFANSDGGVLVYGLEAHGGDRTKPDVVTRVQPLSNLAKSHSEVLALVGQIVGPPVEGVQVTPRPLTRDPGRGLLLVHVPRCDSFLHRSLVDREFYRRHGHGFFRMEHFEIAEFYGRRRNPDLKFWWGVKVAGWSGNAPNRLFNVGIVVGMQNFGRGIAKYPALMLRKPRCHPYGLDGSGRLGLPQRVTLVGDSALFGGGDTVVYPASVLEVTTLQDEIKVQESAPVCPNLMVEYELHAEDMVAVKDELQIKGSEVLEKLRLKGMLV